MPSVPESARAIAEALAPEQTSKAARWRWGTVVSVQDDGTITAAVGGATVSGIRAAQQAMGAAAGDRVRICYLGTEAFADSLRASSKLIKLPSIEAGGLTLGSPLTIANGGTGATTADGAMVALNVVGASDQSKQNARFITLTGATQVYGLWATCINANNTSYNGKEVGVIFENSGMSLWNSTANSTIWKLSGLSGDVNLDTTAWQTLASGVAYRRHRGWVVVNIDSHAYTGSGSEVALGTLPTGYRPSRWSYGALLSTGVGATQVPYVSVDTSGNVKVNGRASGAKLFGEIVFPV